MRILSLVTLYSVFNVILAQYDIINEDIGGLQFYAHVGNLPLKYEPLSSKDQTASNKVADVIDFIQLVPNIDPMVLTKIPPLGIDLPFLWLSGKVGLSNLIIAGVKQLELHGAEMRLINFRADLNITVPQIYFSVDFNLQAALSFMPLLFSCHISANLFDVGVKVISGGYKVQAPPVGDVLQIDSADIHLDINKILVNITNIVIGEEEEVQKLTHYSPTTQLFSRSSFDADDNMLSVLLKIGLDIANQELLKIPIDVFEKYLTSDTY